MSDLRPSLGFGRPGLDPNDADSHETWIAALLADPSLSAEEKRQRLDDALAEMREQDGEDRAEAFEPLERRFFDALSLLADGGHVYGGINASEATDDAVGDDTPVTGPGR